MDNFTNNEAWRFGGPLSLVRALLERLELHVASQGETETIQQLDGMRVLGSEMFLKLIRSQTQYLEYIQVPAHAHQFEKTILRRLPGGNSVSCPITLIHLGKGAEATISERHESESAGASFVAGVQLLILEEGAQLHYSYEQALDPESCTLMLQESRLHKDSLLKQWSQHCGAAWVRQELLCRLLGSGAEARLASGNHSEGTQRLDQRSFQSHEAAHTKSKLLYKNVVADQAIATFAGQILVAENAHEVDAYQSNKNLLLGPQAQIHSLPGLEILADQVRCSHGSASSGIDPDHLFYLESRGIPQDIALKMIASGFLGSAQESLH